MFARAISGTKCFELKWKCSRILQQPDGYSICVIPLQKSQKAGWYLHCMMFSLSLATTSVCSQLMSKVFAIFIHLLRPRFIISLTSFCCIYNNVFVCCWWMLACLVLFCVVQRPKSYSLRLINFNIFEV